MYRSKAPERTLRMDDKPARLIIADDHALLRSGLRSMLYGEPDLEVVGEAADGAEALELCRRLEPDLVLMDVRMPKMDGLAATRAIKEEFPRTSVVMVTMQEDPDYLFEAVLAGAAGYVLKGVTPEKLTDAVRQVLDGEFLFNQRLTIDLSRSMAGREKPATPRGRKSLGHRMGQLLVGAGPFGHAEAHVRDLESFVESIPEGDR